MQDFGLVTVNGQSGTQTFTLQNTGGMASGMITTALTGTDAAMDAAGVNAYGQWYTAHIVNVSGNRATLRNSIKATCGND
jgi:hypothetical protein